MNSLIIPIIESWLNEYKPYSFETRFRFVLEPSQRKQDEQFTPLVFIIEVSGFFEDKAYTKPIKLHHERVIMIDNYNQSPEYISDFKKDLSLFTKTAYESFNTLLKSLDSVYTSDPLHME